MTTDRNGQWELDGFRMGPATVYPVEGATGLSNPGVKTADLPRGSGDGSYQGTDRLEDREIVLALGIDGVPDSPAYGAALDALNAAWASRSAGTAVLQWERFGRRRRAYGRPRGLILPWDDDFHLGAAKAAARFVCGDPVIYDDVETAAPHASGTWTVTNAGNWPVAPVISITGPGGVVVLRNNTDEGKEVVLTGLAGTASVDFARKTVTVGGSDAYGTTSSNAQWWKLLAGGNSITVSGATSVTIAFRSGWTSG